MVILQLGGIVETSARCSCFVSLDLAIKLERLHETYGIASNLTVLFEVQRADRVVQPASTSADIFNPFYL